MRYIDKELWKVLENFKDLGDFDNTREAQRRLAEKLQQMPLGTLLQETKETRKKEENEEAFLKI